MEIVLFLLRKPAPRIDVHLPLRKAQDNSSGFHQKCLCLVQAHDLTYSPACSPGLKVLKSLVGGFGWQKWITVDGSLKVIATLGSGSVAP